MISACIFRVLNSTGIGSNTRYWNLCQWFRKKVMCLFCYFFSSLSSLSLLSCVDWRIVVVLSVCFHCCVYFYQVAHNAVVLPCNLKKKKKFLVLMQWLMLNSRVLLSRPRPQLPTPTSSPTGQRSCSASAQSLSTLEPKENPDLPPKQLLRRRMDSAVSNGYQRPGSV